MGLFLDKLVATFLNIWEQFLPFYATILSLESQNWFPATYFPIPAYFLPINFCRYFGPFGTILGPFDIIFGQGQFLGAIFGNSRSYFGNPMPSSTTFLDILASYGCKTILRGQY